MNVEILTQAADDIIVLHYSGTLQDGLCAAQAHEIDLTIAQAETTVTLVVDVSAVDGDAYDILACMHHMRQRLAGYSDLAYSLYAMDPIFVSDDDVLQERAEFSELLVFNTVDNATQFINAQLERRPHIA